MKPAQTPPHIATLAMIAALSPLAMNIFIPSLPAITEYFKTTPATAQLSVSLYLAATALLQIVFGPLSDKYGRRPVLLILMFVMMLATLGCIYATSIEMFLFARIMQAAAASGIVLSRAIIRDMVEGDRAASMIGYVTMAMTLIPMIGPALGGYLEEFYGWQASFWLIFGYAAITIFVVWFDMGETNQYRGGSFQQQFQAWPTLIKSRRFWGYSATAAFAAGAFFAYLGAGAIVANEYYGLPPSQFGAYFAIVAAGYMLGNFLSGRYSTRIGMTGMMMFGNVCAAGGMILALITTSLFPNAPLAFFGLVFFIGFGNGLTLPSANAGIVGVRPALAGAASGLGGSLQIGGGALLAMITGYMIALDQGPHYLLLIMLLSILFAIAATYYVILIDRNSN
ncbi:MAG: multidrug effflux MFS transporter [Pseudomonadota bacterium]